MPKATAVPQPAPVVINQTVSSAEPAKEKIIKPATDIWSYMASLSPQDWRRHIAYLYREKPIVGLKQAEKYLDKYSQAFTIDDIKERFGGEVFRVMLLKDNKTLMTEQFAIEAAPKFETSRETPGGDTSRDALVRDLIERLDDKTNGGADVADVALGRSVDMMSKAFETALAKIASANGTGAGVTDPFTIIRLMKELGVIGQPQGGLRDTILVLKELGLIGQQQNQFDLFKSMLSTMKELTGELTADTAPTNWKTRLVDKITDAAPQLINQVGGMMDKQAAIERERTHRAEIMVNARSGIAGPQTAQPEPQSAPSPSIQSVRSTDQATTPIRTVPIDRNAEPAPIPPISTEGQPSQQWVSQRVFDAIQAGQSGEAVIDFLDVTNPQITQFFATQTSEQIKALFLKDAILAHAVTLPNFEEWLEEAVEYLHSEDENTAKKPN